MTENFWKNIIGLMIKKFLIFLFVFGFLLRISPEVLALDINIPRVATTPIILPTDQEVLTSPTPRPTPTPEISLPPTSLPSTNVWQLTTIGLAAAIVGGLIVALVLKKGGRNKQEEN